MNSTRMSNEVAQAIMDDLVRKGLLSAEGVKIWVRSGFVCEYCKTDLLSDPQVFGRAEGDHILPKSSHPRLEDDPNNYAMACGLCNKLKRNLDVAKIEAIGVPEHLNELQRQEYIARVWQYLRPRVEETQRVMAAIKCVLQEHGYSV